MLCPHCDTYVSREDKVCPGCGANVEQPHAEEGVRAIRQGRRGRETMQAVTSAPRRAGGASRPPMQPVQSEDEEDEPFYNDEVPLGWDNRPTETGFGRYQHREEREAAFNKRVAPDARRTRVHQVKTHMVNWTHVAIGAACLAVLLAVGAYFYLTRTSGGQVIMVRLGRDATAAALWQVGEEEMDKGNIDRAIIDFEMAWSKDEGDTTTVDNLLLLASAYEAAGRVDDAEALYTKLYTEIVPTRAEPYTNAIRILMSENREPEAADLMKLAYEKTGQNLFRQQRAELLPTAPSVNLVAGLYNTNKTMTLASPQDYDVYYTFDDNAVLPGEGTLYTQPIYLEEGIYKLRAVSVNGELVSDELNGTYKIIMPSPQTPYSTLAPNTYKQRQRVRLRPGDENKNDEDITIYYTIDGSTPDADSPVYTGEPFWLPGGRVTLRAIAVNKYGKMSNMLEILYKITDAAKPLAAYSTDDTIASMSLYSTTKAKFQETYGTGVSTEEVTVSGIDGTGEKITYDWGYAVMAPKKNELVLVELYFTSSRFTGPRSTGIGDTESAIVGAFRDMGQVESPSGNRGLYADNENIGKIFVQDGGGKVIHYRAGTADTHIWQLEYTLNAAGTCVSIDWKFEY